MKYVLLASVLLFVAGCASSAERERNRGGGPPPQRVSSATLPAEASAVALGESALTRKLLTLINKIRAKRGVGTLSPNGQLQRAAAVHSADMVLRDFFGHNNPDGQSPAERMLAVNDDFVGRTAENIQAIEPGPGKSPEQMAGKIVDGWMKSPRHRKAMVSGAYTQTGIGIAFKGREILVTQVFTGP